MEKDGVSIATLYLFPVVKNRPKRSCRRASPSSPSHVGFLLKKISIFACFFFTAMVKLQVDKNVVYSKLHPSKSWLKLDSFCTYLSWGPHIFRHLFFSESKGKRSIFVTEIGLKKGQQHKDPPAAITILTYDWRIIMACLPIWGRCLLKVSVPLWLVKRS